MTNDGTSFWAFRMKRDAVETAKIAINKGITGAIIFLGIGLLFGRFDKGNLDR
jgi:hypothetical protein